MGKSDVIKRKRKTIEKFNLESNKKLKIETEPDTLKNENQMDHSLLLPRLQRVKGQIEGIEKMIYEQRYCPDILIQLKAASSALRAIESKIFEAHLKGCVAQAFTQKESQLTEVKIKEILKLIYS